MRLLKRKPSPPDFTSLSLEQLLFEADAQQDPRLRYQALLEAEQRQPENLAIQRRLLLHGRLHERSASKPDFSVIKCYLLHAFEHPENHDEQSQKAMARELFDDKRLLTCLRLSEDPSAFLRQYLEDLSREYMRIFVAGDNRHIPRVFGISIKGGLQKYLARPARDILDNMLSSPFLHENEATMLAKAFYRAFYEYASGNVQALHSLLGAELMGRLR